MIPDIFHSRSSNHIVMVVVNISHSYDSTNGFHSSFEIIVMAFVNINHSYDSRHDSTPAVQII